MNPGIANPGVPDPGNPGAVQLPPEPFPLLDYLQLLWFRRGLVLIITLLVSVLGWIYVNQLQSIYSAQSVLLIGVQENQQVDLAAYYYQRYFGMESREEVELLRSRGLAEKVISKLKLTQRAEFNPALAEPRESLFSYLGYLNPLRWIPASWKDALRAAGSGEVVVVEPSPEEQTRQVMVRAVDIFLGKLGVEALEMSDVILVSFRSTDPRLAALVANQLPETYMLDKLEAKLEATGRVTGWLSEQLAELEQKVRDSEQAVEIYREEHGLAQGSQTDILGEQLSSVNSQLIIARAERAEAEVRLNQIRRMLQEGVQNIETVSEVLGSAQIQQLRSQEASVQRRISELSVVYGPKHPRMLQVNAELEDVRMRIQEEIQTVVLALQNEVAVARAREASLAQNLSEAEQQTGTQNREAVQLRALEREAAANRTLYETFLSRFKETSSKEGTEAPDARIMSRAEIPAGPAWPNRQRTLMVIVVLGFLGACGLVFMLHLMNPGLYSPEQVEQQLGVHVLGMIPRISGKDLPHQQIIDKPGSSFGEAVDSLKIALKLSDPDTPIKVIQATSSVPEEGKTSLVLSLAAVLSRGGNKVVVVDGDLRRSSIEKKLGINTDAPGLTDLVIADQLTLDGYLVPHPASGIELLRAGRAKYVSASDLFASQRMHAIIRLLRERFDYVLIDAPPVMAVSDARVIGRLADKTLFVVRWDKTPKKVARAALDVLRKSGVPIAGAVLQQVDLKRYGRLGYGDSGYYYHYSRYGQYYTS